MSREKELTEEELEGVAGGFEITGVERLDDPEYSTKPPRRPRRPAPVIKSVDPLPDPPFGTSP